MYTGDKIAINVNGSANDLIELSRGVKQGCVLSPLLFNIFIADLGEELDRTPGIKLGSTEISGMAVNYLKFSQPQINNNYGKVHRIKKWAIQPTQLV